MQLACGSFQLTHMICDNHAVRVERAMLARKKTKLLQHSQLRHWGACGT